MGALSLQPDSGPLNAENYAVLQATAPGVFGSDQSNCLTTRKRHVLEALENPNPNYNSEYVDLGMALGLPNRRSQGVGYVCVTQLREAVGGFHPRVRWKRHRDLA